jgi:uncharacterized protein
MMNHRSNSTIQYQSSLSLATLNSFIMRVYTWMMLGLATTGLTAYGIFSNPSLFMGLMSHKFLFYGIIGLQFLVVLILPFMARKSHKIATAGFFLYAILLGVTLSVIFAVYEFSSIASIFGIASCMFGTMALYGYFTQADLTNFGTIMYMGLFGLIIASFINFFFASEQMHYFISFLGVIIFTGLTAYDMQKIKEAGIELIERGEPIHGAAIMGALILYLDFINLFLHLLELLGKRKK